MTGRRLAGVVALVCGCVASGCVNEYNLQHRYDDGWRVAKVEKVGDDLKAPRSPADDCRSKVLSTANPSPRYAGVWFVEIRRVQRRIVLLPDDRAVAVDSMVYVNLRDCSVPATPAFEPGS